MPFAPLRGRGAFPTCPVRWHVSPLCWRRDQCKPKRRLPPGARCPPPGRLPTATGQPAVKALAGPHPPRLARWPPALSISLSGDLNSSFIIHPFREGALPGRSATAARLRSWRWGTTARKPAKLPPIKEDHEAAGITIFAICIWASTFCCCGASW